MSKYAKSSTAQTLSSMMTMPIINNDQFQHIHIDIFDIFRTHTTITIHFILLVHIVRHGYSNMHVVTRACSCTRLRYCVHDIAHLILCSCNINSRSSQNQGRPHRDCCHAWHQWQWSRRDC